MNDKALVGIDPKNGQVEIIASLREGDFFHNLAEIEKHGFLPVITSKDKAKQYWGDRPDVYDLIVT